MMFLKDLKNTAFADVSGNSSLYRQPEYLYPFVQLLPSVWQITHEFQRLLRRSQYNLLQPEQLPSKLLYQTA
ncbi:MAG TPA: hypothetical protein PLI65_00260 [Bacteroidales bacterium]|nr:hypothetical protein [Bacteroidales bacterium]